MIRSMCVEFNCLTPFFTVLVTEGSIITKTSLLDKLQQKTMYIVSHFCAYILTFFKEYVFGIQLSHAFFFAVLVTEGSIITKTSLLDKLPQKTGYIKPFLCLYFGIF